MSGILSYGYYAVSRSSQFLTDVKNELNVEE